jgi:hypothetical protein
MTVTTINQVVNNNTQLTIVLQDHENWQNDTGLLSPNGGSQGVNISIPWCTSLSDFYAGHYLAVWDQNGTPFVIWQNGNQVCYATNDAFSYSGACIPTDCATGGNRKLIIGGNASSPTITLVPN